MYRTMKQLIFLFSIVLMRSMASAQSTGLCQGNYYTEKELTGRYSLSNRSL